MNKFTYWTNKVITVEDAVELNELGYVLELNDGIIVRIEKEDR